MKLPKFSALPKKFKRPVIVRRVRGASMVPALAPGQLVVGRTHFRSLRPGRIVIFRHEGREKIKRLSKLEGGRIWLTGENPQSSTDSRDFGWLPKTVVTAVIFYPRPGKIQDSLPDR